MPVTRGFMFADLRGYTDFVESHGDAAARDLLRSYRELVREVIGRFDGAEIRTEGDSFYVVFGSTTGAVRCGLEIVAAAAGQPDHPIKVGIGIHAGESAEDAEGYVGLAVNIAARICSLARPGEVLVSDTVRSLTRSSGALTFTPRGRPHLKGVTEPVAVFAVTDGRTTAPAGASGGFDPRRRRRLATIAVVSGLAIAAAAGAFAIGPLGSSSAPSPTASLGSTARGSGDSPGAAAISSATVSASGTGSPSILPLPISDGLAPHVTAPPGRYATTSFEPQMEFRLANGWEAVEDDPDSLGLMRQTSPRGKPDGSLSFSRVRLGFDRPCAASTSTLIGEGPDSLLRWLQSRDFLTVSAPTAVNVGGVSGVRIEAVVATKGPGCPNLSTSDPDWYALFPGGRGAFYLEPGEKVSFTVLDVDGQTVLITTEQSPTEESDFDKEIATFLVTLGFP